MKTDQITDPQSANSLPGSAASVSASKPPVGAQPGKSNSMPSSGLCLVTDLDLPNSLQMSIKSQQKSFAKSIASAPASPAPTYQTPDNPEKEGGSASRARAVGSSPKSSELSGKYNPAGWSLRTSRRCSIRTIRQTLNKSSAPLPTAGMWDSGECLMLNISASPKNAKGFSWSAVLEKCPPLSCYLTPLQWSQYLARLHRSSSHGGKPMTGLGILYSRKTSTHASLLAMSFSLLRKTDSIRWLTGRECLKRQGFPSEWMRPTLRRLSLPGTLSAPKSQLGSLGFSMAKLMQHASYRKPER